MQTFRRIAAVLIFPAIVWLVAACERETPTAAPPRPLATVGGPTCNVPADYATIQAAVNDPGCSTIDVAPGVYVETVTIPRTVTLNGAQADVDARTRAVPLSSESVVGAPDGAFQIEGNNVVINGFTIEGVVSNPSVFPFTGLGAGIWTNPDFIGTLGGHQILNNIIQNNIVGIYLNNRCTFGTLVRFNLIRNNTAPGPASGNAIYSDVGLCNALINQNKFSGNTSGSVLVIGPPVTTNTTADISVTNNELVGGTPESISFLGVSSSTIMGNVSIGSTSSGTVDLFGGNSQVMVTGNTLFNGVRAVVVSDPFLVGINTGITANQNCIQGNSIAGMEVDPLAYPTTPQLNAENNWWGSASGPKEFPRHTSGMGDNIIDPDQNVDFDPWLKSCPTGAAPRIVNGGGQINVTGGVGSFGFSAKQATQSGHLDYLNHFTGTHLNCTVNAVTILSTTKAHLSGMCSSSH